MWTALTLLACRAPEGGPPPAPEPTSPTTPEPPPPPDPTDPGPDVADDDAWFRRDHLLEVELELAPADWDALRRETRDVLDTLGGADCLLEPWVSPWGDYRATVTIDGERVADVGVSKKGFLGSLSTERPSLKVDTDTFVDDLVTANGTERLLLHNNLQDPSAVRQCLAYDVFRAAGHEAPRCNLAHVTVNGEDLGVYTHVEAVRSDYLRRHHASDEGDLYEGALSDFLDGWMATFDPKTNDTDPTLGPVEDLADALASPDGQLLAALERELDVDGFLRFWAVEGLIGHLDGYAANMNNFFYYVDDETDVGTFTPWGVDATFVDPALDPVVANAWLAQRLYALPEGRDGLLRAHRAALRDAWDEAALQATIDQLADLARPHVADAVAYDAAVDGVRAYVDGRRAVVEAVLDAGGPDLGEPTPREPLCLTPIGEVTASFSTTWDSFAVDPFAAGYTAALAGSVDGSPLPTFPVGAPQAGADGYGNAVISVLVLDPTYTWFEQLVLVFPEDDLRPGIREIDLVDSYGVLQYGPLDGSTAPELAGYVFGDLVLTAATAAPGAPLTGSFVGEVYRF